MSSELRITLDGRERAVALGVTIGQLLENTTGIATAEAAEAAGSAASELGQPTAEIVAARVDGYQRDLSHELSGGETVETIPIGSDEGRAILRHSTAHVLAQAVQELFPEAKLGIGPPIEYGFYYDFDVARPFTPEDLASIEQRMREIVKGGQRFSRRAIPDDQAKAELAREPYKLELIGLKGGTDDEASVEVGGDVLTMYDNMAPGSGERVWTDLCRGPHLPTTRHIPAFKLLRSGGAYWRGDEQNPQLQRIYGTAWESRQAQDDYLRLREEAERRDHRRLGHELDLFSFPPEIGSGLPVFHPKGGLVRRTMEDHSRQRHEEAGYSFVYSPHIAKSTLFETSGHLPWYAQNFYPPMEMEGADYYPKPMNCPLHILVYRSRGRSYRELPLRLFELGTVYRFEKSGVVHGLTRVRGLTQDDSHIFCAPEQLAEELSTLIRFVHGVLRDFGLTDFECEFATRPESYVGDPERWDEAEAALRHALEAADLPYVVAEGEGAFYAPKVDLHMRDAIGRRWQLSTLQVDLQLPVRFDLEYQASDGSRRRPYMIHRALFGSIERFLGILLEHYAGALPPWLAPVQVVGIPIADEHAAHLERVAAELRAHGIRAEVDTSDERMQKKIRNAQQQKIPYMLLAGGHDVAAGAVSFRYRSGEQKNGVPVADAVAEITHAVAEHLQV